MTKEVTVEVVRVFTDEAGEYGNPVGVVLDMEQRLTKQDRQHVATVLGYSETVFMNSIEQPDVNIFDTLHEVQFAGHALVGAAWLISVIGNKPTDVIRCGNIDIATWQAGPMRWIRAAIALTPPWNHEQLASPALVDAITDDEATTMEHTFVWAWQDEERGKVRARTFLPDWGILEDQGNSSGSMQRAASVGKEIEITHGIGSIIHARPAQNDQAEVGGRVQRDSAIIVTI